MAEPVLEIPFHDAFQFDPSPTFAQLRENRPVARVRTLAGAEVWLVTRYDDVRLVLADPRSDLTEYIDKLVTRKLANTAPEA